jgi:CheY-like chemotaxis protein
MTIVPELRETLPIAVCTAGAERLAQARQATAANPLMQQPFDQPLRGKRVLIVEDEPLLFMDMESSLMEAGCEVVGPVGTLCKAKQLIAGTECDAALLDVNLAGESIDEVAVALTQRNIPFAFVTGYEREALPQAFQETLILGKPFSRDQLRSAVQALLDRAADPRSVAAKTGSDLARAQRAD